MTEKAIEAAAEALFRFKHCIGSDWTALAQEWQKQYYRNEVAPIIAAYEAVIDREKPTHRHKKSGTEYVLIGYGKMQAEHWEDTRGAFDEGGYIGGDSVDMHEVAIYRSVDDGSLWVRPKEEFEDGRFEEIATEDI